ncbi:hypothetical protein GGX14DRAFT_396123 [Mycena pura]|uniref:Uncharacterized protein n=1 Tax=Mycena pura TaxID=153505 RepID=A0AAD6VB43_9AGAR|nr:hypothetical protein GGX14DRAFT_396123 [Mycena pura]
MSSPPGLGPCDDVGDVRSNIVEVTPVTQTKAYLCGTAFETAYLEICELMGLPAAMASLGFKWSRDTASAPIRQLSNATEWGICLDEGLRMAVRARKHAVSVQIHNLEYHELKEKLKCGKHSPQLCHVKVDGHHHPVPPNDMTLWAKEICTGKATLTKPPEITSFSQYFCPGPCKRARTSAPTSLPTNNIPTIHVHINTGSMSIAEAPSPTRSPLSTITATVSHAENVEMPLSLFHSQPNILDENNIPNDDSSVLTFPVVVFMDTLESLQITCANHVPIANADFYVDLVKMPLELAELFVEESMHVIGWAQKGKESALIPEKLEKYMYNRIIQM